MASLLVALSFMRVPTRWLLIALAGLVVVGIVAYATRDRSGPSIPAEYERPEDVRIPMPGPERVKTAMEQARGFYTHKFADRRITLALDEESRFRLIVNRDDGVSHEAHGTWSLTGSRLTMAYHHVPGMASVTPAEPQVVTNEWRKTAVVLRDSSQPHPVVLEKRTAIRQK